MTSPFTGLYVSEMRGSVVRDDVHILFCDFLLDTGNAEDQLKLDAYLDDVRSLLMEALEEEDLWIAYYPITRTVR